MIFLIDYCRIITPKVLDVLKKKNVRATFFILGTTISKTVDLNGLGAPNQQNWRENRTILRRIVEEGHSIGIHGFDHRNWTDLSQLNWLKQVIVTESLINQTAKIKTWILRAPCG